MDETVPPPPPASPSPAPQPAVVVAPVKSYKGFAVTSWILFVVTCLIAMVPIVGFISWPMAFVVIPLILIFAVITLTRGGTAQGILLIIGSVVVMPAFLVIAPLASTILVGAAGVAHDQKQEGQISANLKSIDAAKDEWAIQTNAAAGAAVTMTDITKYLHGKPVKPVVGETYDPRPVGEQPTATLPANTSLVGRKGGDVLTAESIAASSSSSSSPSSSPSPASATASASPEATAAAEESPSATPTPDEE